MRRRHELRMACILALLALLACGGSGSTQAPQAATTDEVEALATAPAAAPGSELSAEPGPGEWDEAIDPESLSEPGTHGNARIGFTAADAAKGRLWLEDTNGVVLEVQTEMKGGGRSRTGSADLEVRNDRAPRHIGSGAR